MYLLLSYYSSFKGEAFQKFLVWQLKKFFVKKSGEMWGKVGFLRPFFNEPEGTKSTVGRKTISVSFTTVLYDSMRRQGKGWVEEVPVLYGTVRAVNILLLSSQSNDNNKRHAIKQELETLNTCQDMMAEKFNYLKRIQNIL